MLVIQPNVDVIRYGVGDGCTPTTRELYTDQE